MIFSSKTVLRLAVVLLAFASSIPVFGQQKEFTVGRVTYECRGSDDVAVKEIDISTHDVSDTIVIDIPERVTSGGKEYAVTAIGTGEGCPSLLKTFNTGAGSTYYTVRIPSSVCDVYAGTFANDGNSNGCRVSLEFQPNDNIKSWPVGMFKDSPLRRIVLPNGVWTDIPRDFCRNTPPSEVVLPDNCRSIGDYAFASPEETHGRIWDMRLNYGLKTIGAYAFYNTSVITEDRKWQNGTYTLTLPTSVTSIGESAFEGMYYIFRIEIPGSVKVISKRAFARWGYARDLILGEGVERIEQEAFAQNGAVIWSPYGNSTLGIEYYVLPSTVKYIGKDAFADAQLLRGIEMHGTIPVTGGDIVSQEDYADVTLYVPKSSLYSYQSKWKKFQTLKSLDERWTGSVILSQNIREGGTVKGSGIYGQGERVRLYAMPAEGYSFLGWLRSDVLVSTDTEYDIVATGSAENILAVFAPVGDSTQTRPDELYTRIDYTAGNNTPSCTFLSMVPRRGVERDTDWKFDVSFSEGDNIIGPRGYAEVEYIHIHPDKYPSYTDNALLDCDIVNGTIGTCYGISSPSFPVEDEYDAEGNPLPSYFMNLRMPVINTKTGERDTLCYTAEVFLHGVDDPEVAFMNDGEVMSSVVYDDEYYASGFVTGLDMKNGFDMMLTVIKSKDGKQVDTESVERHFDAGELTYDSEEFEKYGEGCNIFPDMNCRYTNADITLAGSYDKNYDYTFNLRARNYRADGKPGGWIQRTICENNGKVDIKKLNATVKVNNKETSIAENEVTNVDNKEAVDNLISCVYDYFFLPIMRGVKANTDVVIKVNSYPESWGNCELWMSNASEPEKEIMLSGNVAKREDITVTFPADGRTHHCYLRWPSIDLERTVAFSDHTPQKFNRYRFDVNLVGVGSDKVEDLYIVYETADGAINSKLIKRADWELDKLNFDRAEAGFTIEEDREITRVVSLTDSVPLGNLHMVPMPSKLDKVNSYRAWLQNKSADISTLVNTINLYTTTEVYFKLVDATTGKQITEGTDIRFVCRSTPLTKWFLEDYPSVEENSGRQPNGLVKAAMVQDDQQPILYADGYIPYHIRNGLKVTGNKVDADGYVGYADAEGKVTITLPMRRRDSNHTFDIMGIYYRTPGIDSIKADYDNNEELPWQPVGYSGAGTRIAYEGAFQPTCNRWGQTANGDKRIPTLAISVVYYDNDKVDTSVPNGYKTNDKPLGNTLSFMKLTSKERNYSQEITPAGTYLFDRTASTKCIREILKCYGLRTSTEEEKKEADRLKYCFVTYIWYPDNSLVLPEHEDEIYASIGGNEIKLGTLKNLTEDKMYLSSEAQTEGPVGEERVGDMSAREDLGEFNSSFNNFKIDMPQNTAAYNADFDLDIELPTQGALLPFNIGVQRVNNDLVVRGVISYNFLPGGQAMDLMDKTDLVSDIDKMFFDIQRAVTHDDKEYAREDRALGFSTAFVGVRGWLEGRLAQNKHGYFVPQAVGLGIKAEASGMFNSGIRTPFFHATMSLGGELSTYAALDAATDTTGLGWAVNKNAKYFADMVQHTTVALNTSFAIGTGVDLYVARAVCGVKGSLSASFDSEVRYRPYLQGARKKYEAMVDKPEIGVPPSYTYAGSKMQVAGSIKAYAEAKFLWWKTRKEATLASFDKRWYDPNNYTNPLWVADHVNAKTHTVLRSSAYRPLQLSAVAQNSNVILRDIDAYAEPRYLFGGKDLAYYKINADDITDGHIMFRNGGTFNDGAGEPIVTTDVSSSDNCGIVAYEVSTASADNMMDETEAPKHMGIKASVNNGTGWTTPVMLTGNMPANYMPRTAIDDNGKAAVAWKGGEFIASDYEDVDKAGMVSGGLYMRTYDGTDWGDPIKLAATVRGNSISDYALTMHDGKPYMLATFGREIEEDNVTSTVHTLAAIGYDKYGIPMLVESRHRASSPQIVSFGSKIFGAAIVTDAGTAEDSETTTAKKADVHLYSLNDDGMLEDLGALGLGNRNIADFHLVKSDKAMALVWRESSQILNEQTNLFDITPSVYGALVRSSVDDDGNTVYFLSCPQLIAKAENGLDISFYDAYLPDESSMTGVVTLYDSETGGANVVECTNYFDNGFNIRHAGIDTKVERGSDYGYYIVVFNEGKDVIDYVDLQFGNENVTHTIPTCIYPGHDEVLTDVALYTVDLENGIEPKVIPHFNDSFLQARSYAMAKASSTDVGSVNRRTASVGQKAMPKVQLQVVDINVRPLSVLIAGTDKYYVASTGTEVNVPEESVGKFTDTIPDNYTTVLVNVMNDSPISLKSDYKTNISLCYDVKGLRPYEYAHSVDIPASKFEDDGDNTVARILVGKVPESVMLYAVAVTTDGEGNIVKDQNMVNNASPVRLEKNDIEEVPTGFDDVIIIKTPDVKPELKVETTDEGVIVRGLAKGETLRVYDTTGVMLHLYRADSSGDSHKVKLTKHGIYVFSNGRESIKFAY